MSVSTVFNTIDLKSECKDMYDQRHIGTVLIKSALREDFRVKLRDDILRISKHFTEVRKEDVPVRHNFSAMYLSCRGEPEGRQIASITTVWTCAQLAKAYSLEVYNQVGGIFGFEPTLMLNSFGMHKYDKKIGEIAYHRDFASYTNLIGVVSVEGNALFNVSKPKEEERSYTVGPGDMLLMRANREGTNEQSDLRPFHMIKALDEDRYSINIRKDTRNILR